ncbi:glycosyltransferase family 2 protein [bacterium]|nr:MAG: glycosyltransferase family 2 protein [bacterium]
MKISVVIPTYNRSTKIKPTVDSVLGQRLAADSFEIIIVNDGSTDDTESVLQQLYGDDARVRLFSLPNGGVAKARNFGLREAQGEFIAFLDHDDIWLPEKLERQVALLERAPEVGVVYSGWQDVDEMGKPLAEDDLRRLKPKFGFPTGRVFDILVRGNFIVSASVPLIRTQLLRDIGGFDPATQPCDDWDVWLRLARRCEFARVEENLVCYVHHNEQQSANVNRMWRAEGRALNKHRRAVWRQPKTLWRILAHTIFLRTLDPWYHAARAAVGQGDWGQVRKQLILCFLYRPMMIGVPQWLYVLKRFVTRDARPF